jgi:amino-acid N-acetyltransferase
MSTDIKFDRPDLAMFTRPAFPSDQKDIEALLVSAGLPTKGAFDAHCHFVVATSGGELVGCAAVERYGEDGLLRSVAVRADKRDLGIARALIELAISMWQPAGMKRLTLLTETAAPYFEKFGFRQIERSEAPPAVAASVEFRDVCPASATTMVLGLS